MNNEKGAKEHYRVQYHPQRAMSQINYQVYQYVESLKGVKTIFEFGCNVGRHLIQFRKRGYRVFGIDINATNIFEARFLNELWATELGDEASLEKIPDGAFDLVFTNSVLCHIEEVDEIMNQLSRIAAKHIIMCEAVEKQGKYWWLHEYPGKQVFARKSQQNKLYKTYHYETK